MNGSNRFDNISAYKNNNNSDILLVPTIRFEFDDPEQAEKVKKTCRYKFFGSMK